MVSLTVYRECPNCHSYDVRTSRVRSGERLLRLVCLKPFRCMECGVRFLGWIWAKRNTASVPETERKVS